MSERLRLGRFSWRQILGAALVLLILVVGGREVANNHSKLMFEAIGGLAFCLLATQRGLCVAVLALVALNGIPFIANSHAIAHHIALQDLACLLLIGVALVWIIADERRPRTRLSIVLSWCGAALLSWCVLMVVRTWAVDGTPLLGAIRFGRDFLYFGALLIVLPRVQFRERDIVILIAVLGAGVCAYAVGQIVTVEGLANPTWLVHAGTVEQSLGITRLYTEMTDLVSAGVAFGIAALVLSSRRSQYRIAPITVLLTASLVLQLTRARWIATITSVVLVSVWLGLQAERGIAGILRRRLLVFIALVVGILTAFLLLAPGVIATGPFFKRIVSIFTDLNSSTSTVGLRRQIASEMISLLGPHWFMGLGLTPPSVHFYPQFPSGSIRDPDVGVLNAVMTIGVMGAILIYLPMVAALVHCMRRARLAVRDRFSWLNYGGQIWILATLGSSITLVSLFSPSGLVLSAVILAVLSQPLVVGTDRATDATDADGTLAAPLAPPPAPPAVRSRGDGVGRQTRRRARSAVPRG
jgi:hypothetical protein